MTSSPPSSPPPPTSPISGFRKESLKLLTTAVNAEPTTTATARSTTLPRRRNFLKPVNTGSSCRVLASRRRKADCERRRRRGRGQPLGRRGIHREHPQARRRIGRGPFPPRRGRRGQDGGAPRADGRP